jgi:hypothetical protein
VQIIIDDPSSLPPGTLRTLESIAATIAAAWDVEHTPWGTHRAITISGGTVTGVLWLKDTPAPRHNPTSANGGFLYAEDGALKWRGGDGTVTTIAPA